MRCLQAITGGAIICIVFTYLLMTSSVAGLSKYLEETDADKRADFAEQFRRFALWSLLAKVCKPRTSQPHMHRLNCVPCAPQMYIWQFIVNNQTWAATDPKYRPS
jgi:hypothetical protein